MNPELQTAPLSTAAVWTGRVISGLCVLFLAADAIAKVAEVQQVIDASVQLGIRAETIRGIGLTLLVSTLLYAIPATSVLGAVLLTGYLGGAIATHVRVGGPVFPIVFSATFGVLVWLGLYLRDHRLHALMPLRSPAPEADRSTARGFTVRETTPAA